MAEEEKDIKDEKDPSATGGEDRTAPTPPAYTGPTAEEWKALQDQNKELAEMVKGMQEYFVEDEPEFDPSGLDLSDPRQLAQLVGAVVDQRLQGVTPYVRNAAQDQGERQLMSMLDEYEKDLKGDYPDGFDKALAKRAAFAIFDETGDAQNSVKEAAKYAAEVRASERKTAIEEYRTKSTRSRFTDPEAEAAAMTAEPKPKTFDEVMEKWGAQSEV